ncbi:S-adenosyl-L-methionine-dependent methyltransferase [Stipitochalara longipes BDJ]|nr:S-adenosyl-L-methionine-dependent methyltransferase [Stipitochalara longipes BDJ]
MPGKHAPPARRNAGDGREVDLLHYIFSRSDLAELRGQPNKVLAAIDEYVENHNRLMNIGPYKGAFISKIIAERKPSVMIELGGYVGYSAVLFGDAVRANGGKQYISLEINPENAAVANMIVELAGLREFVRIIVGSSSESLIRLIKVDKYISHIELLFIDHWKDLYLSDLLLLEELNVLKPGVSVLAADNVIMPGAPEYLEYVRASPAQKREMAEKRELTLSKSGADNSLTKEKAIDPNLVVGNPNLVYESSIEMFEWDSGRRKDGVEVTKVIGEEAA